MIDLCKKRGSDKREKLTPNFRGDPPTNNVGLLVMKFESTNKAEMFNRGEKEEDDDDSQKVKEIPIVRSLYGTATLYYRVSHKRFVILTAAHNFVQTEVTMSGEDETKVASDAWFFLH